VVGPPVGHHANDRPGPVEERLAGGLGADAVNEDDSDPVEIDFQRCRGSAELQW
jgi:hypothetical protein